MSAKGESYKSPKAKKKHESRESSKEMRKEYGATGAKRKKIAREWKAGELNIGKSSKKVPRTKAGQKQMVAIMMSQTGAKKKAPKRGK